jgi:CHAD domain-containing protein
MAYRFKLDETMTRGFQRIATEQLDRAATHLYALENSAVTSIHETRKCLKRTRALLRFCRPGLEEEAFHSLNQQLRDSGRLLSSKRDADVLKQTIDSLAQGGKLKPTIVTRLQAATAIARQASTEETHAAPDHRHITAQLQSVREEILGVELSVNSRSIDTRGLSRSFEACHRTFVPAFGDEDDLAVHEWRKTVQIHWRHMQLINRAWPAYCDARIAEARAISMLIGDVRDLGLLLDFAAGPASEKLTPPMIVSIRTLVRSKQEDLRKEAKLRGALLLGEKPKGLARRMQAYWETAAELKDATSKSSREAADRLPLARLTSDTR